MTADTAALRALIARLRDPWPDTYAPDKNYMAQAADALERLARERDEARAERDAAISEREDHRNAWIEATKRMGQANRVGADEPTRKDGERSGQGASTGAQDVRGPSPLPEPSAPPPKAAP